MEKEIFIIGTGFSQAVCKEIPLLNSLSEEVEKNICNFNGDNYSAEYELIYYKEIKRKNFKNFEDILTYLYHYTPWKSKEENSKLTALYFYIIRNLVNIFIEKEEKYKHLFDNNEIDNFKLNTLKKFINYLHYTKSKIITFNY